MQGRNLAISLVVLGFILVMLVVARRSEPEPQQEPASSTEPATPPRRATGPRATTGLPAEAPPQLRPPSIEDAARRRADRADRAEATAQLLEQLLDPPPPEEPSTDTPGDQLRRAATIASLDAGIKAQLPQIKECYDAWLQQEPDLEGVLKVQFTMIAGEDEDGEPIGLVADVEVTDSELNNVWMEGCVAGAMEEAELPEPPDGELVVQYPFDFQRRR